MRRITGGLILVLALAASAQAAPDRMTAVNVVPPGESGNTTLAQFSAATAGLSSSYGPNTDDQEPLYANWTYKPMQFAGIGTGTAPAGDPDVLITRDPTYSVPTITGKTDGDTFFGIGYAMAQDRLFQMEAFRHVGHGTLAELTGPSGLEMDEQVRRFSEGSAALDREFHRLPAAAQLRLKRFVDGINAYIGTLDPSDTPAEFTLLDDLPVKPWTVGDVLGFGEYAGRFFGEFGHSELAAAALRQHLVATYGKRKAAKIFDDVLPLQDRHAPTSISRRDGVFPRHVGRRVHGTPRSLPGVTRAATTLFKDTLAVHLAQRRLGIPRFGSNAAIVAPRLSADHKAMLYGGPQTGWAVPGFFWEAELHSPGRDERGVFVPAIPVMVIGRTGDTAWTVTSALDDNADTFVEHLDKTDSTYRHDGKTLKVGVRHVTLGCNNPPSNATALLSAETPELCPSTPKTLTLYRSVHGPAIIAPDAHHDLFVRDSVVDGRLLKSLTAWDAAGRQHTPKRFGAALRRMSLGFNFFYADDSGHIAYWHTGTYPIHPRGVDTRLPLPGDGRYDWQGFERWRAHPHVIDPKSGFIVNWNNKPAVGWYSKSLDPGGEGGIWGDHWESEPLAADVKAKAPLTLQSLGQVPRDVAYVDNRARVLKPYLVKALAGDASMTAIEGYLRAWNGRRDDVGADGYSTPAVVFFDRFVEHLLRNTLEPVAGPNWYLFAGLDTPGGKLVSVDNLSAPTYKFEYPGLQTIAAALAHHTKYHWLPHPTAALRKAAADAAAELTAAQGSDPAKWNEPVEQTTWTAQGGISAPPITPLMNRGSYGQVVEGR